jgi:hypothetical protein
MGEGKGGWGKFRRNEEVSKRLLGKLSNSRLFLRD